MGHRQKMTPKKRVEWDIMQYKARLDASKGHSHSYMSDKLYEQLEKKGYVSYKFSTTHETTSEYEAIAIRDKLRKDGNFARIVSTANKLRIRTFEVYYRFKTNSNNHERHI